MLRGQVGDVFPGAGLAVGEQVEPGVDDLGEQVRGPAAPVKAQYGLAVFPGDLAQLGQQLLDLPGQRGGRFGHDDQQRVPGAVGDPGLLRRRAGELQPGHVHLLYLPRAEVRPGVPIDAEEPEVVRAGRRAAPGYGHLQVRGLAGGGEPGELAADRLGFRCPVQAQDAAHRRRGDAGGALGAGLAQQRLQHLVDQDRVQAVVAVADPGVDLAGAFQQARVRQGGQSDQQPGQRVGPPAANTGAAPSPKPEPGQDAFPVPRHRVRQHRQQPAGGLGSLGPACGAVLTCGLVRSVGGSIVLASAAAAAAGCCSSRAAAPSSASWRAALPSSRLRSPRRGGSSRAGTAARGRAGTRPRAVRTAKVETPHRLAIASRPRPRASRSLISAVSPG